MAPVGVHRDGGDVGNRLWNGEMGVTIMCPR